MTPRSPTPPYEQGSPEDTADLPALAPAAQGAEEGAQEHPPAWQDARRGTAQADRMELREAQRQYDREVDTLAEWVSDDEIPSDDEAMQAELREQVLVLQEAEQKLATMRARITRKRTQQRARRARGAHPDRRGGHQEAAVRGVLQDQSAPGGARSPPPSQRLFNPVEAARLASEAATVTGDVLGQATVTGDVHIHVHRGQGATPWSPKPKDCKPLTNRERLAVPHGDRARSDLGIAQALVLERERFTRAITTAFTDAQWDITAEGRAGTASRHALFALVSGSIHADWHRLTDWRGQRLWAIDEAARRSVALAVTDNYAWYLRWGFDVPEGQDALAAHVDGLIDLALGFENLQAMQNAATTMWYGLKFFREVYDDRGKRRVPVTAERFRVMALRCHSAYAAARIAQQLPAPSVEEVRARLLEALPVNLQMWARPARGLEFHGTPAAELDSERGAFDIERISKRTGIPLGQMTQVRFIEGACQEIAVFFNRRPGLHDQGCDRVWRPTDTAWLEEPERADLVKTVSPEGSGGRSGGGGRGKFVPRKASSRRNSDAGMNTAEPSVRAMNAGWSPPDWWLSGETHPNGKPVPSPEKAALMADAECHSCKQVGHHKWCCPNDGFEATGSGS